MTSRRPAAGATVLLVCTGNVCRSPAAELLLRSALEALDAVDVTVTSAGTRALVGQPVHPPMARLLTDAGVPVGSFAARQLTAELVAEADLVLALAREHRSAVVTLVPGALRRTLLLGDAVTAATASRGAGWPAPTPSARLRALPGLAPRHRSPAPGVVADVPDPYLGPETAYRAAFDVVDDAVGRLVAALR